MARRPAGPGIAAGLAAVGILAALLTTACADAARPKRGAPAARAGVIDLRAWDFERDGPLPLNGEWRFTWALPALLPPGAKTTTVIEDVPGQWDGFPGIGRGAYLLEVLLPPRAPPLWLAKSHADSAFVLTAHAPGSEPARVLGSGVVGDDAASEVAYGRTSAGPLPHGDHLFLRSDVSNFHYPRGGEGAGPWIGTFAQLEERRDDQRARNFFIAGFLFVSGLYHLALWVLRRSERAPLWFGLFCLVLSVRTLERGRHLEDLFAAWQLWATTKRIEYLGFFLAVVLFIAYLQALTGGGLQRHFKWLFQGAFLLLSLVVITTPPVIFGHVADLSQLIALGAIAWMIAEIVRSWLRTRDAILGAVLAGFLVLGATVVLDMLSNKDVISLPVATPLGECVFVAAQAAVIASANARARRRAEDLTRELVRVSKLKDEFLANTSHELRTPLNAIINIPHGLLQQIEERAVVACTACGDAFAPEHEDVDVSAMACPSCGKTRTLKMERRRFVPEDADALASHLRAIVGSGEHLLAVVNDILDSSKLAAGTMVLAPEDVAVADVVGRALVSTRPMADAAGVALDVDVGAGLRVRADPLRLAQVIVNLVSNAVKFSPRGGRVRIAAVDGVELRVIDQGIGIAPEHHALIFESFRQVESSHTRKHGGTGLGLAIVKQIVELHGGTVTVESALGKGAAFIVRLPSAATTTTSKLAE